MHLNLRTFAIGLFQFFQDLATLKGKEEYKLRAGEAAVLVDLQRGNTHAHLEKNGESYDVVLCSRSMHACQDVEGFFMGQ